MSGGHVPNRYPDDAPLATVPPTYPPQFSPYTPLRRAPSLDFHPTSYNTNSSSPPMADQENVPTPGTSDRKRKPDGYQLDASPKRLRQDISSGSPRSPLATQSQSRSNANCQHGTQHNYGAFPATPESTPEQARQTTQRPQTVESARPTLPHDLRQAGLPVHHPDPSRKKRRYYAVPGGKQPGIYGNYDDVQAQCNGYSGSCQKSFSTEDLAWGFMEENRHKIEESLRRQREEAQKLENSRPVFEAQNAQRTPSSPPSHTTALATPPSEQSHASTSSTPSHAANNYVREPQVELTLEQKKVVQKILDGKNVFYTGSAGCGKSTILKTFVPLLTKRGKRVQIIAPTNLAALNVDGQTIFAFAGWTPDDMEKTLHDLKEAACGNEQWKKFNEIDVLVIDEISMIENLRFELLNEVMKASRSGKPNGSKPFGGVQIVVTGDFCQLAPVKPFQYCIGCESKLEEESNGNEYVCKNGDCDYKRWHRTDKWAFRSTAWQECNFEHINLTKIHRQEDKKFINVLQQIRRDGFITSYHKDILLNKENKDPVTAAGGGVKIFSLCRDVYRENKQTVDKLPGQRYTFKCCDTFDRGDTESSSMAKYAETMLYSRTKEYKKNNEYFEELKKDAKLWPEHVVMPDPENEDVEILKGLQHHRYNAIVHLKEGMRVILQANIEPSCGLVNGMQGSIIGFEPFDPKALPRAPDDDFGGELRGPDPDYAEEQIEEYAHQNGCQPWPVVRFDNGRTRTIYADCAINRAGSIGEQAKTGRPAKMSRTQIPLAAGYAITVHKSQGMTLDRVQAYLHDCFEGSQLYVALSRARSLRGLNVWSLPPKEKRLYADDQVKAFFKKYLDPSSPYSASQTTQSPQSPQAPQASTALQSSQTSQALQSPGSTQQPYQVSQSSQSPLAQKSNQMLPPSQEPPSSQLSQASQEWL